jgi:hypothetical protein
MSLKVFHIFFIILAILLSGGVAVWAFLNQADRGFAIACAVAAFLLLVYGIYFIRKSKRIIT